MTRPLVLLFPGQSSRDPEMFDRLRTIDTPLADRFADEARSRGAPPLQQAFESNLAVQLWVHAASRGYAALLEAAGINATASAGLSLGEYAHLVDIEALDEASCFDLVQRRGECYDAGPAGVMAALHPLTTEVVEQLVATVSTRFPGALAPAVFTSPSQTVVAGSSEAVALAIELAEEAYGMGVVIEHRIPMHTPLFEPVVAHFAPVLEGMPWRTARRDYWPNVHGETMPAATPAQIIELLSQHVHHPVRWRQTIDGLVATYPDALFVEVGPRTVLTDLMKRRWHPQVEVLPLDAGPDGDPRRVFEQAVQQIRGACV